MTTSQHFPNARPEATAAAQPPAVMPFFFDGAQVRVVSREGEPWFVLADVCRVLEIANARDAAGRLDEDEKGVVTTDTPGGPQQTTIINESGLYSLILTSRKPEAKRFKKWVTGTVLPTIRKTGGYMEAAPDETPEALALRAMRVLQDTIERQKSKLAETMPKAEALDRIAKADGSLTLSEAAKTLQMAPKRLITWMRMNGWIFQRAGRNVAYQPRIAQGYLEHKVATIERDDGTEKVVEQVRVTPRGLAHLSKVLGE